MYKFSAPMPYSIEDIDKILEINKEVEKSAITSMYACVPRGCEVFTGFEQARNYTLKNTSWNYWKRLIEYVLLRECDFVYLLNSPRFLDITNPDYTKQLEKLELLLGELNKIGVKKLRIGTGQLMKYIVKHYSSFEILASTSLEYKTIWEYQNFMDFCPEIKQIYPSSDINKNFKLLSLLRKHYSETEIELMVNEGCLQGCPNRILHAYINMDKVSRINNDECLSDDYAKSFCYSVIMKYPIQSLVLGGHIFPWDIEEYAKIGIKNFKFAGRDGYVEFPKYVKGFKMYLKGIDDIKSIENYSIADFTHHLMNNAVLEQLSVKDYKKYLPDIKHFVKKGDLCSSICSAECRYCYKCADKIQSVFRAKQNEKRKKSTPACVFKII